MKSRSAFEFTVRKMLRQNPKLYFWTFTLREVHSLTKAMRLWNQFLTLLKRKVQISRVCECWSCTKNTDATFTSSRIGDFRFERFWHWRSGRVRSNRCATSHGYGSSCKISL